MTRVWRTAAVVVWCLWLTLGVAGCDAATGPSRTQSRLRVTNVGSATIEGLVVLFPDDRLEFGDVRAGATTPYRTSRGGVFGYAAYEFRVDGAVRLQPVIDWVGATPLNGTAFRYSLELVDERPAGIAIRLVAVRPEF